MVLICNCCNREIEVCRCMVWNPYHGSRPLAAACGIWGGYLGQKDPGDETKPNISTPEIDALYPKPDPVAELSEHEKERIWETLKQAARG